ncbi:ABC transporter permease [Pseudochelatococcus lubricantis]|uniref:ABC transporter permease n=1 Tax=Pseudochelatococcus lubricantis TaxID=1538102 RepID=UPI0035EB1038
MGTRPTDREAPVQAAGLFVGMSRRGGLALSPTLHTLRQIALFAWIPLLTSWFGNGEATKLCFVAISTFFPLFLATEQGLRTVPATLREVAGVLHLSRRRTITALLLPAALPSIGVGVQIALISAWIGTVGAEYAIGNGRGLGSYIASARDQFRMDIVIVGVAVLAAVGAGLHYLSRAAIARLTPWNSPRSGA